LQITPVLALLAASNKPVSTLSPGCFMPIKI
jgi:hypothetical protein